MVEIIQLIYLSIGIVLTILFAISFIRNNAKNMQQGYVLVFGKEVSTFTFGYNLASNNFGLLFLYLFVFPFLWLPIMLYVYVLKGE